MIKVAILGLITVLIAVQFKSGKAEYATYIGFAGCLILFLYGIRKLETILGALNKLQGYMNIGESYILLLLKIVGVTYIAEFSADLCKDAGYVAIAGQIEFVGKLTILSISMPVLVSLLESIHNFL
ncbi:MAG: stage III sporulation AC/AD family protein [Acetivibrio sp.]